MTSDTPDARRSDPFLAGAYGLTDLAEAMSFYAEWADEYDDRMEDTLGYIAPRAMAERLAAHLSGSDLEVLDAGCGTGLTGRYLAELGVDHIDGVDLSPGMLARARERGVHRTLIEADLTKPLPIEPGRYDAVISSGTFTLGHVGSEAIPELVRVVGSGGFLGCTIHVELWDDGGFGDLFADLEQQSILRTIERITGEFFTGLGETALYCVFQKR